MSRRMRIGWALASVCRAFPLVALVHCVPRDTTPERGAIEMTVTGSEGVLSGIPATSFEDGWSITFDHSLVFIGVVSGSWSYSNGDASVSFDDECHFPYEETGPHLLNIQRPWNALLRAVEPKRCNILFNWHTPYKDEIIGPSSFGSGVTLGPGVTQEDFDMLKTRYASAHIGILAQRGAVTKRVAATFRLFDTTSLGVVYSCAEGSDGGGLGGVVVPSGDKVEARIVLNGEQLFRTQLAVGAGALRFDAWARADDDSRWGNHDGIITSEELSAVPLASIEPADGTYVDARYGAKSLGAFITIQSRFLWQFGNHGLCARLPER
jgi:hypothetical protein